jgi:hypothetical protein
MNIPAILFGCLFATLFGSLFHFWRGGNFRRFLLFQLLGWLGFWIGDLAGILLKWNFLSVGVLRLGMASLVSILFLFLGNWLFRPHFSSGSEQK